MWRPSVGRASSVRIVLLRDTLFRLSLEAREKIQNIFFATRVRNDVMQDEHIVCTVYMGLPVVQVQGTKYLVLVLGTACYVLVH